jgi:hypothetical protein
MTSITITIEPEQKSKTRRFQRIVVYFFLFLGKAHCGV